MTQTPDPDFTPPPERPGQLSPRIGDAERDRAVTALQEHMAQGRLDGSEFDERLTRALSARTAADLEPLFADLPGPRPDGLAPAPDCTPPPWSATAAVARNEAGPTTADFQQVASSRPPMPRGATVALAAVWPATVVLYVVTDFRYWWLFVVAAMVTYFVRRAFGPSGEGPSESGEEHRRLGR